MTKICKGCRITKSKDEFFKNKLTKDGLDAKCKLCKLEYKKAWRLTYKGMESRRIEHSRERAIKMGCEEVESISIKTLEELLKAQNSKCAECGNDISDRNERHLDHIKPLIKGGAHSINNLQWLCIKCNLLKGDLYENDPL